MTSPEKVALGEGSGKRGRSNCGQAVYRISPDLIHVVLGSVVMGYDQGQLLTQPVPATPQTWSCCPHYCHS